MQKLLSVVLLFLFSLSLSAGWGEDLCEDVTCSGHGECHDDGEDEWCVCDEGYIASGMNCILGCDGVTCSGHGVCSVVSGAEVCTCEAGFNATGLNCILNEASTVDTLAILNETDCYNTGNCHYRLIFATNAYSFNPSIASLYDIIVNVLDSENVWHNYRKTVAQCVTEGVCDNVDAQYVDFWFQHEVNGNQYITVEVLGNGDDASDDMYHDVLIDYCYNVDCGTGGSCDDSSGYPVCSCDYGYVLRGNSCEEGWFEDENLAAAVVELLQYKGYDVETETDIDPEILADIDYLALNRKNISSLVGIELFSSLTVLDISGNNISDLSPLADCEELVILNMSGNPASDLSPLSTLPLVSLDISYSGVFDMQPLADMNTLEEIIFADRDNGKYEMLLHENFNAIDWLIDKNGTACLKPVYNSRTGVNVPVSNPDCSGGGICLNGRCLCSEGYYYDNGDCHAVSNCASDEHWDSDRHYCMPDKKDADCPEPPENAVISDKDQLEWNGTEYVLPAGRTLELCRYGDSSCANSACHWKCAGGYHFVKDDICASDAARNIPDSAYNQLILPNISRHDVALEPVPGVPSFAPVLKAGIYYDEKKNLVAGWHFDLPRVEFAIDGVGKIVPLESWDQKTVYVTMPWGKEEYSLPVEKRCFDSNDGPVDCGRYSSVKSVQVTYYPAPGQNVFSYIVLRTTAEAYESFTNNFGHAISGSDDVWTVTRYGEDGSVTEFSRGRIFTAGEEEDYAKRPAYYTFMDYIPISKHTTREGRETSFSYEWDRTEMKGSYHHYNIRSARITDPLKRVIKIESLSNSENPSYGLIGRPDDDHKTVCRPLEGSLEISAGKVDDNDNPVEPLRKVAAYSFSDGFGMSAEIYVKNGWIRRDNYSRNGNIFYLSSTTGRDSVGETTWEFTEENDTPDGYIERKKVKDQEYIVKTVKGNFYSPKQGKNPKYYSLSDAPYKTAAVYSIDGSGISGKKRIVEDYFTNWLQPAKKVTCERNYSDEEEDCDGISNTVTEEIRYNVPGSPVYFKNADGQVTVNLYDTTNEASPLNYIIHFLSDPLNYSNAINLNITLPVPDFIRADNLHKSGTMACSAVYSLDANENIISAMLSQYISDGIVPNLGWCSNSEYRRVTNYEWKREDDDWEKPYDLKTVTYPDGKVREFTYDYEISEGSAGKVWGETITGSNNQNTLQTCYEYDENYQLVAQGIGPAGNSCIPKKGFGFDSSGLLMTRDFSIDENDSEVLENNYIYDYLGRKLVERNSAGVSTVYVYDSLDRVVFTFFGCNVDSNSFGTVYNPYNFDDTGSAGEDGRGVAFDYHNDEFPYARYINLNTCEYYRKYKYDVMSNLVETYFFEYWGAGSNNQIVKNTTSPKIIKQTTEYDMLGRAVKSCQSDGSISNPTDADKRCIETEHDAFGNIIKKTENGEERIITYDLRNRPITVTVDGLPTEQYSYSSSTAGGYFGYDSIRNKYENIDPLTTYKDKWGRAAKSVDPFGNETETTYESDYSDNITSQTTTSSTIKTGETAWTYDDLDRKLSETRKQFIPGSESTTNVNHVTWWDYDSIGNVISVESSDGTKQTYSYDTLNRPVETVNYERINSNWVETSSSENSYDASGRLFRTETTKDNKTIREDYSFDTFGRITSVKTTDPANSSRYRVKFYNTGGQVIWEADEESDSDPRNFADLGLWHVEVGNQKYYTYNAFGDLEKTVYVMTNNGKGFGSPDINPWLNDSQITTNFTYDIFGRITSRINDRSGVTEYNYYDTNAASSHRRNKLESIQITPALTDNDTGYQDSDSSTQTYTYTYNDKGDESSVEYTEGNSYSMEVAFTRDDYGRITGKTSNGSVPVTQTFTYNNRNLLETATDTVGNAATSVTRYYDSFGNPYSEAVSANNITKTVSRRMIDAKTYQFTYPDGKTLRKTATGNDLDSIEYNNAEIASYSRANGVLAAVTKGQNLIETFSYNNWNLLANHTINNANADIYDMNYNYSRGWHLIEKADGIKNTSDKYSYDSYYRLKEVKYDFANNTAARTDNFYQDGVHNIEQSTENGVTYAWGVDKLNHLREKEIGGNTAVTYKYDERNNMISEDRSGTTDDKTYIYDDLNRLIEVKDGSQNTIATYTYDAFNRRITKTVGSTTERYSYDDWNIVEISTNSNDYANIIDSAMDRHIAIEVTANNTSTLYYFLTDERGNVTALTDANGNILERYRYRVYGDFEILDSQFTPKNCNNQTCYATNLHNFLWGGSLYEPETGLYWMRNRYYHIDMHRFINQDPIGIWGDANNLGNGFAYVAGMVIEASDPTGLISQENSYDIILNTDKEFYQVRQMTEEERKQSINWMSNVAFNIAWPIVFGNPVGLGIGIAATLLTIVGDLDNTNHSFTFVVSLTLSRSEEYYSIINTLKVANKSYSYKLLVAGLVKDAIFLGFDLHSLYKDNNVPSENSLLNENLDSDKLKTLLLDNGDIVIADENGKIVHCSGDCSKTPEGSYLDADLLKTLWGIYPSDPYEDASDMIQNIIRINILTKMLKLGENEQPPFFTDTSTGPNGAIMIYKNPYYVNKDPLKTILFDGDNGSGKPMLYRNPFVPGAEYGYDSTTYEKFQHSGFPQTNVDPYFE